MKSNSNAIARVVGTMMDAALATAAHASLVRSDENPELAALADRDDASASNPAWLRALRRSAAARSSVRTVDRLVAALAASKTVPAYLDVLETLTVVCDDSPDVRAAVRAYAPLPDDDDARPPSEARSSDMLSEMESTS